MGKLGMNKFQREADVAVNAAARHGEEWANKAQHLMEEGAEWVAPRAQKLWDETVKATAPMIDEAAEKMRPYLDEAQDKVRPYLDEAQHRAEDYAERGKKAAKAAQKAASGKGTLSEKAQAVSKATRKELTKPKRSKARTFGKAVGWTLLGTAAAGIGYLLWRRSQPVEDPWAEEYWADLDTDVEVPQTPAEPVEGAAATVSTEDSAEPKAEAAAKADVDEATPREDPKFDKDNVEKIEDEDIK